MGKTAGKNQAVQKSKKEEKEEMKVEFTVTKEGKEQDPKLQELQKRRSAYKGNLTYSIQMQEKYSNEYTVAMQKEPIDQTEVDRLELKLREADLRINFYKEKLIKVEEEIIRYKLEKKQKEKTSEKEENESAA